MEIPGYTIKRMLGKGGMASVYLAVQDKFDRDVALKVMAPALSADPNFRDRFLREAKIVAKISHPNIVAVYDVNEVNDIYYIAMEFHPGGDLKSKIRAGLTPRESINIIRDIAKALDYAHSKGYLHRDIKPDNILFRADGSAVLTDFGIAKATEGDANLTQMGLVAGTPKYMSPEQARGLPLEADSDLYSLGVVFFEALTGSLPYQATDPIALGIMHLNSPIPKLEGRLSHFQPLLDRLMAKNAADRPHRGSEVVRELDALAATFDFDADDDAGASQSEATAFRPTFQPGANLGSATRPPVKPAAGAAAPAPAKARKSPLPLVLVAVAVLGVAGTGGYMMMHGSAPESAPPPVATTPNPVNNVQDRLDRAAVAFERGDLVTPQGKSAADIYHLVLIQDPNNAAAQGGLQQIATALQQQALAALGTNDIAQAKLHMEQLRTLSPNDPGLLSLQKSIAAAEAAASKPHVADQHRAQAPVAAAAPAPEPEPVVQAAPPTVVQQQSAPAAEQDDEDAQEASKIEQENALKRLQVRGLLGVAQQALTEGDNATAVTRFQQVLHIEPGNVEARDGLNKAKAALAASP